MQPESTIKRCDHSVYDPDGEARYCTLCTPVKITGEVLKRIKTSVGPLTLIIETQAQVVDEWEARLESARLTMDRGATPYDSVAINTFLRANGPDTGLVAEVMKGFQIVKEEAE